MMEASSQRALRSRLTVMLMLGVVAASACVAALMWWKASAAFAQEATSPAARFVIRCDFSHRNNGDPIVYPGQPGAAHRHDSFGDRSTNYAPADKSAYWIPTVVSPGSNPGPATSTRKGEPVSEDSLCSVQ